MKAEIEKLPVIVDSYGREIFPATIFYVLGLDNYQQYYFELKLLFNSNISEMILIRKEFDKNDLKKIIHLLEKKVMPNLSYRHRKIYSKEVKSLTEIVLEVDKVKDIFQKIEFADFYDR